MPPKGKKAAAKNKSEAPPAKTTEGEKKIKSEKTPTVSPDPGATGETTTSSESKEAGAQIGLSEEEKDAREEVEFEKYATILKEGRAQFGCEGYLTILVHSCEK